MFVKSIKWTKDYWLRIDKNKQILWNSLGNFQWKNGKYYDIDEELIIPIIENSKYEKDLVDTFKMALRKYPSTSAVLVRNHGMYVLEISEFKSRLETQII